MSTPDPAPARWSPALVYTAARIALFLSVAVVLYLVGFRTFALVLLALVISMPLSYVVLRRQREAFAAQVERRVEHRRAEKEKLRAALRGDDDI
jgi:C4-dicarboxylate-specific signal transduction histidine kinase